MGISENRFEMKARYDWYRQGTMFSGQNEEAAITCFNESLKIDPIYMPARKGKSNALLKLDRIEEAIACYDEVIKIEPINKLAWAAKGDALKGLERYEEAIACYNEVIKIEPINKLAWETKGDALYNLGREKEAIACFAKAFTVSPSPPSSPRNELLTATTDSDTSSAPPSLSQQTVLSTPPEPQWQQATAALIDEINSAKTQHTLQPTPTQTSVAQQAQDLKITLNENEQRRQALATERERLRQQHIPQNNARENEAHKHQLEQLDAKLDDLQTKQAVLWAKHQRKQAQVAAIRAFHQEPRLCLYYTTVQLSLEKILIGYKAAASHLLQLKTNRLDSAANNLDTAGESTTTNTDRNNTFAHLKNAGQWLSENSDQIMASVEKGMSLLGSTFEFIPGVGAALKAGASGLHAVAETRNVNQMKALAQLATLPVFLKATEQLARTLTEQYQTQILALPNPEDEAQQRASLKQASDKLKQASDKLKQASDKLKHVLLKDAVTSSVEKFAEYAALLVLQSLHQGSRPVNYSDANAWQTQWLMAIQRPPTENLGLLETHCQAQATSRSLQVITQQQKPWPLNAVYARTGIHTNGKYFAYAQADAHLYGFRQGSAAQATQLGMHVVQGAMHSSSVALSKASRQQLQRVGHELDTERKKRADTQREHHAQQTRLEEKIKQANLAVSKQQHSPRFFAAPSAPQARDLKQAVNQLKQHYPTVFAGVTLKQSAKIITFSAADAPLLEQLAMQLSYWPEITDCTEPRDSNLAVTVKTSFLAGRLKGAFTQANMSLTLESVNSETSTTAP